MRVGDISVVLRVRDKDGRVNSLHMHLTNACNNDNQWKLTEMAAEVL